MMDRDETFAEALLRELIDHQARGNELAERHVGAVLKLVAAVDRLEKRVQSVEDTISSASLFGGS